MSTGTSHGTSKLFTPAVMDDSYLHMAITGPPGSGKTYSALKIAQGIVESDDQIAVIDTERGSAAKYKRICKFFHLKLASFAPRMYVEAIRAAEEEGFKVVVIDSLSHCWEGKDGVLESVNKLTDESRSKNAFTAGWSKMTPEHQSLFSAIYDSGIHVIGTMRSRFKHVIIDRIPTKIGVRPVQRKDAEYEFDIILDMNTNNQARVTKSRFSPIPQGSIIDKPDQKVGKILADWLTEGVEVDSPFAAPDQNVKSATLGAIDAETLQEIRDLGAQLRGMTDEIWAKVAAGYGASDIAGLTQIQGEELIKKLEAKVEARKAKDALEAQEKAREEAREDKESSAAQGGGEGEEEGETETEDGEEAGEESGEETGKETVTPTTTAIPSTSAIIDPVPASAPVTVPSESATNKSESATPIAITTSLPDPSIPRVSPDLVADIESQAAILGLTDAQLAKACGKRGADTVAGLTVEGAKDLRAALQAHIDRQSGDAATSVPPPAATPTVTPAASTPSTPDTPTATRDIESTIPDSGDSPDLVLSGGAPDKAAKETKEPKKRKTKAATTATAEATPA